ncbi:polysaccharide biosynthesis protein [Aquibaculum arenosum]|uniref:Nucleoside-diphosphate sugar epimerase/dehydratase n=1 Tax=Aquibaculum arenosum TaxID=3032591 RepID=A0ABT5YLJ8_9PROT|nr:nucleoside-diphosphate sugar epimerase/dehydratase [Fodinicurvata sp. CAU 1616]MDF2095826.1 nucleoside-diphosphate sugar epimerase/dehydratase [Fodinicurvata sp. CAU 1616]
MTERVVQLPGRGGADLLPGSLAGVSGRNALAFAHDMLWVLASAFFAFWLTANLGTFEHVLTPALGTFLLVMLPLQGAAFLLLRLDRGIWRFVSLSDLLCILKAVALGSVAGVLVLYFLGALPSVPRSAIVLYPALLGGGLAASRIVLRWSVEGRHRPEQSKRALVLGAGSAADLLIRDLLKQEDYRPVGILDDAREKQGSTLHGVPVLGHLGQLASRLRGPGIDVVLIAMPSAPGRVIRGLYDTCARAKVPCITLPRLSELASGRVGIARLRAVQLEDLLGREVVEIDAAAVRRFIAGKTILVTGAGGSIGSELVRQIAAQDPRHLILLDSGEYNLYAIEREVAERFPGLAFSASLTDIRDRARLRTVFERYRPEIVVHAAAYKHVPLVESNPVAGVEANVFGTRNVADLAVEFEAATFVEVSTDKAVNPRNVMGASKRLAEIYCQALDGRSQTAFITTRFGNVLGSAGSVVPLFRRQIESGGPVTVTHPDITRYFMTIPEAVSLILQAAAMGEGGEIFVLDMGEPVRIADLARQMIQLSGLLPGEDIGIAYTGLRPGEKLTEELFHPQEALAPTAHPKIMRARARDAAWDSLQQQLERLHALCQAGDASELRAALCEIMPEACLLEAQEEAPPGSLELAPPPPRLSLVRQKDKPAGATQQPSSRHIGSGRSFKQIILRARREEAVPPP